MLRLYLVCLAAFILLCWTDTTDAKHKKFRTHRNRGRFAVHRGSQGNYGTGSSGCEPDTPQVPNVLQPMKVDPHLLLGKWYYYLRYYIGIRTDMCNSTNTITTFNSLVHGTLHPATGSSAVLFEQLYGYWDLHTMQCGEPESYLGYLTPNGAESAIGYFGPDAFSVDNSVVLATDYNTYGLHYTCNTYSIGSGLCDSPFFYVFTRTRPDQLTSTTIDSIARTINGLLSQYCVTADMFVAEVWVPSWGECPFVIPTDPCYQALRQAHLDVAGASA